MFIERVGNPYNVDHYRFRIEKQPINQQMLNRPQKKIDNNLEKTLFVISSTPPLCRLDMHPDEFLQVSGQSKGALWSSISQARDNLQTSPHCL